MILFGEGQQIGEHEYVVTLRGFDTTHSDGRKVLKDSHMISYQILTLNPQRLLIDCREILHRATDAMAIREAISIADMLEAMLAVSWGDGLQAIINRQIKHQMSQFDRESGVRADFAVGVLNHLNDMAAKHGVNTNEEGEL